jgi:hypothetical protein
MTRLITFTDENMTIAADICQKSALSNNVDEVKVYKPWDIDERFYKIHEDLFHHTRGFGYWIWKPYFINRELMNMKDGDILIYSDAGVEIINNVNHIIDRMDSDVWLFGNMWEHQHWCKGDVLYKAEGIGDICQKHIRCKTFHKRMAKILSSARLY